MKKSWKRATAVLLACGMLAAMTGCGQDKQTGANGDSITLSLFSIGDGMPSYKEGMGVFVEAEKETGVHLKNFLSQSASDAAQALTVMMSSGTLADIIKFNKRGDIAKYGTSGAVIPLNDYINETDTPNIYKYFQAHPEVKKEIEEYDGNIYYLPFLMDTEEMNVSECWFIRQDWLDKLNLQAPTTVEEFHDVLYAFATQDPNGNGQKDEVPYFHRNKTIEPLLGLWGAHAGWYINDNDELCYGPVEEAYGIAYKNIAQWYKEGLIDKELFTRSNARDALLANDQGGCTHDWAGSTASYNDSLASSVDGFRLNWMLPPKNVNGEVRESYSRIPVAGYGWSISATNKHPKETAKYFDFWFSEKGSNLANYGVEGEHYDMVDGKPTFKEQLLHSDRPVLDIIRDSGAQWQYAFVQDFDYEKQWLNKDALACMEAYKQDVKFDKVAPYLKFSEADEKRLNELLPDIGTKINELSQQWVLGAVDVDATFDQYISDLKAMGVDEAIAIRRAAYNNLK